MAAPRVRQPRIGFLNTSGTLAATEAQDTFAGTGVLGYTGAMGAVEAPDVFAGVGTFAFVFGGIMAAVENPDIFAGVGLLEVLGVLAATEPPDVFHADGVVDGFLLAGSATGAQGGTGAGKKWVWQWDSDLGAPENNEDMTFDPRKKSVPSDPIRYAKPKVKPYRGARDRIKFRWKQED